MNRVAKALFTGVLAGSVAVQAATATKEIQLPPETVKLRASTLAGFEIATQKCAICHSADYIAYQPPDMSQTQWTGEVAKMRGTYGAPIDDTEIRLVGAYLAASYGNSKSVNEADLVVKSTGTSPAPDASATTPAGAMDVQALLTRNACLGCHALSQKVVGPAYHDVAVKYKDDPLAAMKLESTFAKAARAAGARHRCPPSRP